MIGAEAGDSMTYSNTEQQALAFVTYSLRPWLVLIEQALSRDRDLFPERVYCEFLLDALLRADSTTRARGLHEGARPGHRLDAPRRGPPPREPRARDSQPAEHRSPALQRTEMIA